MEGVINLPKYFHHGNSLHELFKDSWDFQIFCFIFLDLVPSTLTHLSIRNSVSNYLNNRSICLVKRLYILLPRPTKKIVILSFLVCFTKNVTFHFLEKVLSHININITIFSFHLTHKTKSPKISCRPTSVTSFVGRREYILWLTEPDFLAEGPRRL